MFFENTNKILDAIVEGKSVSTNDPRVANAAEKINKLKTIKEDARNMLLKTISLSSSLGSIEVNIKFLMDEIESIMNELNLQSENNAAFVQETTASMEEIDNAVDDNVKMMDQILNNIAQIVENNDKNMESVNLMGQVCEKVTESNNAVNETLTKLLNNLNEIGNIIAVIEQIADQTNLLALNARIEAARAGEAGRGFAVVSEEIRKLADSTKQSLDEFKGFTQEIQKDSARSLESMKTTNEVMRQIPIVTKTIKDTVEGNFSAIDNIKKEMEGFAASFEQISAAVNEITTAMNSLSQKTEEITNIIYRLDGDIKNLDSIKHSISEIDNSFIEQNKKYYQKFMESDNEITAQELVEILQNAIKQHDLWMQTLEEAINSNKLMPLQTDGDKCSFGHFYNAIVINDNDIKDLWQNVDEYHHKLHQAGQSALIAIKNKETEAAKKYYQIAKENSQKVHQMIDKMISNLKNKASA